MMEIPRFVILIVIFGIASYYDLRTREVPDYVWLFGGAAGALLYVFDWDMVDSFALFCIGLGCLIALLTWKVFPMGDADALGILTASILCPVLHGFVISPVVVFFGGLILEHLAAFLYNLRYNIVDVIQGRGLFKEVSGSWLVRAAALYSVHRKRPREKFTFCAEEVRSGKRTLSLKTPPAESPYETRTGIFVMWAMPAFPFMTLALVLGAVATLFLGFL